MHIRQLTGKLTSALPSFLFVAKHYFCGSVQLHTEVGSWVKFNHGSCFGCEHSSKIHHRWYWGWAEETYAVMKAVSP